MRSLSTLVIRPGDAFWSAMPMIARIGSPFFGSGRGTSPHEQVTDGVLVFRWPDDPYDVADLANPTNWRLLP